ncbi:MAG: hypothetical protein Fur0015_08870 [Ignavibacteriales bacterium]
MKKYISAFVSGFGAGVLQIVPVAKSFSCCLIVPIASYIAIVLDRRATGNIDKLSLKHGLLFGLMTGIYAALFGSFFDLIITFITHNNDFIFAISELQKVVNNFPLDEKIKQEVFSMIGNVASDIQRNGFSVLYSFSVIFNNFIINPIFGMLGGLISVQIINSKLTNDKYGN